MIKQRTLKNSISFEGQGIHTGKNVRLFIEPAAPNEGIVFTRLDLNPELKVQAIIDNVCVDEMRQTALMVGKGGMTRTIEHLMAAFHGLGVDNAHVKLDAEELPGMDGSAREYVEALSRTGFQEQDAPRKFIEIDRPIIVDHGDQSLVAIPAKQMSISYTLSYRHRDLQDQFLTLSILPEIFERELAPARTFCLKEEAQALLAQGFGRGASLDNTLVFENNIPIDNKLRFDNEACRHKMMDLLGDLYLAGGFLKAHVIATRSGHSRNLELVRKLKMAAKKQSSDYGTRLDVKAIQEIIPHRYPFLFVDRIENFKPGEHATGFKMVSTNDYFFQGHFPGHPVMPGVIMIEAMAQVGGVIMLSKPENKGKIAYFMSLDKAKFRQPVHPGDELRLEVQVQKIRARTGQCSGRAFVGDKLVCEAEVKFAVVEP